MKYRAIYFTDGKLRLLDQSKLPTEVAYVDCRSHYEVHTCIREMRVCGDQSIGIAAAYGMAMAVDNLILPNGGNIDKWNDLLFEMEKVAAFLKEVAPSSIPNRMFCRAKDEIRDREFDIAYLRTRLIQTAGKITEEIRNSCEKIGAYGSHKICSGMQLLTHGHWGSLAAPEQGTALAPMYAAKITKNFNVYVCETRPLLQGARLTAWELKESGFTPTIVCDNVAAQLMKHKRVDMVIVGASKIAKNGDTASTTGTYGLAVLAKIHNIPFYIATPITTFDMRIKSIDDFKIEQRCSRGISELTSVYNPSFDVTPHDLITGIISDHGIITPVNGGQIERSLAY